MAFDEHMRAERDVLSRLALQNVHSSRCIEGRLLRAGHGEDCSGGPGRKLLHRPRAGNGGAGVMGGSGRGERWSEAGCGLAAAFLVDWRWSGERGRNPGCL